MYALEIQTLNSVRLLLLPLQSFCIFFIRFCDQIYTFLESSHSDLTICKNSKLIKIGDIVLIEMTFGVRTEESCWINGSVSTL